MLETGIIYVYRNKINKKCYVGQTIHPENRHKAHIRSANDGDNSKFHRALRKYGLDNFDYFVACKINASPEYLKRSLNSLEKFYINFYNSFENGYNMTEGGDGTRLFGEANGMYNKKHKAESNEKNRQAHLGNKHNKETIKKISDWQLENSPVRGTHPSEEAKEKNRQAHLGKKLTNEHKEKIKENAKTNPNYGTKGKHLSEKTRNSISYTLKTRERSEEEIERCKEGGRISGSKIWVCNAQQVKRIEPNELNFYISIGYKRGRKYI